MNLEETYAIVTGGASGLGEATVRAIISGGGKVAILDMDCIRGNELVNELGTSAIFCKTDVTNEGDVKSAIEKTIETFGKLNVAVRALPSISFD